MGIHQFSTADPPKQRKPSAFGLYHQEVGIIRHRSLLLDIGGCLRTSGVCIDEEKTQKS